MRQGLNLVLLILMLVAGFNVTVNAASVYTTPVPTTQWVGTMHMTATGDWAPLGVTLLYSVALDNHDADGTAIYKYDYSFIEYGSGPDDGLDNMILEFSVSCNTDPGCFRDDPRWYAAGELPHLPAGMNAALWGADHANNRGVYGFHFLSNRLPVWGNFFAEGAGDNAWAFNAGLVDEGSGDTSKFIPRPDGDVKGIVDGDVGTVPEPGTWWTMGGALLIAVIYGLVRRRRYVKERGGGGGNSYSRNRYVASRYRDGLDGRDGGQ